MNNGPHSVILIFTDYFPNSHFFLSLLSFILFSVLHHFPSNKMCKIFVSNHDTRYQKLHCINQSHVINNYFKIPMSKMPENTEVTPWTHGRRKYLSTKVIWAQLCSEYLQGCLLMLNT